MLKNRSNDGNVESTIHAFPSSSFSMITCVSKIYDILERKDICWKINFF